MSKNLDQVYIANPITSNASTDLMYFGQSPYGAGNDAAMTYANFALQFGAPYTPAALTKTDDTNVTLTLGGTPATALLHATSITAGWTGQLAIGRGGTGVASVTTTPTATSWAGWDANKNFSANTFTSSFQNYVLIGGSTTLTVASPQYVHVGGSGGSVILPDATTLALTHSYYIDNDASGNVSVYLNDTSTLLNTIVPGAFLTVYLASNGTTNGVWYNYFSLPNNVQWGGSTLPLAYGGTNANLTATVNNLVYSTASAFALLATGNNGTLITSNTGVPSISSTLPTTVQGNITQLGTQSQALNMGTNLINNVSDPVNAQDAATKNYVNSIAAGLNPVDGVVAASTVNLNATYANGTAGVGATLTDASGTFAAFSIDSVSPAVGSRVLIKNQSTTFQNGIYNLTTNGDGISIPYVLTRSTNYNTPAQIQVGDLISVDTGATQAISSWYQTATVVTIGTSPITFSVFFNPASYVSSTLASGKVFRGNGSNVAVASTSTYPDTVAINNLLYASSANVIAGLATADSGVLVTSSTGVPSILAAGTTGQVLQASTSGTPAWSTPTYPTASGTSGKFLISDGTNNVYSTSTIPTSAGASAGKILVSDGTNYILSTPTFPNASATSGKIIISDGTNWIASTPTYPNTSGSAGKVVISDGTNNVYSTPTFPNASATSGKIIKSDGTNWTASTETYAAPGTSGNVMTSDGTNWTSAASSTGSAFTSINVQTFTNSGTYTPTSKMKYAMIECIGGGGGGGGTAASTEIGCGGGGGGGSYSRKLTTAVAVGSSQTVTVGTGGGGGSAGNNNGTNGNDTSVGSLCIAKGGTAGGGAAANSAGTGGAGGIAGTGDVTIVGNAGSRGGNSSGINNTVIPSGLGGNGPWGGGGVSTANTTGASATNYGGGGQGGSSVGNASAFAGGSGSAGFVIITEYISS